MSRYLLWVRISTTQTANTILFAENALAAKQLGEVRTLAIVTGDSGGS
jgi:hypothetical protein